jgi:hypothetical protein
MRHTKEATEIALLFFIYPDDVHEISIPIVLNASLSVPFTAYTIEKEKPDDLIEGVPT